MKVKHTLLNKTAGIFKTIPALTGNVKLVFKDSDNAKFAQLINNHNYTTLKYSESLPYSSNVATFLKTLAKPYYCKHYDINADSANALKTTYPQQYDYTYQWGARFGVRKDKHRFFAPLWITDKHMPKYFVIMAAKHTGDEVVANKAQTFKIIKTFDLENGLFAKIYDSICKSTQFTNAPMHFNEDYVTCTGINIDTGITTQAKFNAINLAQTEHSLMESESLLTAIFRNNRLILNNLLNLEFEFELEDHADYDIIGMYADDAFSKAIQDPTTNLSNDYANFLSVCQTALHTKSNKHSELKTLSTGDTPNLEPYERLLRRFDSNSVKQLFVNVHRRATFEIRKAIAVGDYVKIVENGKEFKVYCSTVRNQDIFFKFSGELETQMSNLQDAIDRLDTTNIYKLKYAKRVLTIEAINASNDDQVYIDIPDAWFPINVSFRRPSDIKTEYGYELMPLIDKDHAVKIDVKLLQGLKYSEFDVAEFLSKTLKEKYDIENQVLVDNELHLVFRNKLNAEIFEQQFVMSLFDREFVQFKVLSFLDILTFDARTISYSTQNNHQTFKHVSFLKDTFADNERLTEYLKSVKNESPYISEITLSKVDYADNPYARFKEYDISDFALVNKINQNFVKWASISGFNCYGEPMSANVSLAYNQANLGPVFDANVNHDIHTLQYDYFLMNTKNLDDTNNYLAEVITGAPTLRNFTFKHSTIIHGAFEVSRKFDNLAVIDVKAGIAGKAFCIFKGVEYEFSDFYKGYKFGIVHTVHDEFKIVEHVNRHEKLIIIEIQHPVATYTLNGYQTLEPVTNLYRFAYYANFVDLITGETQDFSKMSFTQFVDYVNSKDNIETKVVKPKNILVNTYLTVEEDGLSHKFAQSNQIVTYLLQRYSLNCTPQVYELVTTYDYEDLKNVVLPPHRTPVYDYGIFKIGDANTLSTDDNPNDIQSKHYLAGEVVYDLIEFNANTNTVINRFYTHKTQYEQIGYVLANISSVVSVLRNIDLSNIERKFVAVDSVELDAKQMLLDKISQKYNGRYRPDSLPHFADYVLSCYKYEIKIYDDEGKLLDTQHFDTDSKMISQFKFDQVRTVVAKLEFE